MPTVAWPLRVDINLKKWLDRSALGGGLLDELWSRRLPRHHRATRRVRRTSWPSRCYRSRRQWPLPEDAWALRMPAAVFHTKVGIPGDAACPWQRPLFARRRRPRAERARGHQCSMRVAAIAGV